MYLNPSASAPMSFFTSGLVIKLLEDHSGSEVSRTVDIHPTGERGGRDTTLVGLYNVGPVTRTDVTVGESTHTHT